MIIGNAFETKSGQMHTSEIETISELLSVTHCSKTATTHTLLESASGTIHVHP